MGAHQVRSMTTDDDLHFFPGSWAAWNVWTRFRGPRNIPRTLKEEHFTHRNIICARSLNGHPLDSLKETSTEKSKNKAAQRDTSSLYFISDGKFKPIDKCFLKWPILKKLPLRYSGRNSCGKWDQVELTCSNSPDQQNRLWNLNVSTIRLAF